MRTPILLPIAALLLAACAGNPLPPPTADQPTDTSMINTAYWTAQPYCAGRVQMRLPAERRYGSRNQGQTESYRYNDWQINHYVDDWRSAPKPSTAPNAASRKSSPFGTPSWPPSNRWNKPAAQAKGYLKRFFCFR